MDESSEQPRTCPYCAEAVKSEALVCPHCRSPLRSPITPPLHRDRPGRQVAGVAVALADHFGISVTFVRLGFVVTAFIKGLGVLAYGLLWLLLPFEAGGRSPLGRAVGSLEGEDGNGRPLFERAVEGLRSLWAQLSRPASRPASDTAPGGGGQEPPQGAV